MSQIKPRDTEPELIMRSYLSALGLRYGLYHKGLPGRPDIVFPNAKVAVFCDGDFWHGRNWNLRKRNRPFRTRKKYWNNKIEENIRRDRRNNCDLRKIGWKVMRFWETDIRKRGELIALRVMIAVEEADQK